MGDDPQGRFGWWACAMLSFMYVVYTLLAGLNAATDKQPESAKGLIVAARYLTAISRRVHDQDGWPRRSHSHHLRAGRLLDCGRRRQGGVWRPHLGHRGGQVLGGGGLAAGLICLDLGMCIPSAGWRFVFLAIGYHFLHIASGCWQNTFRSLHH